MRKYLILIGISILITGLFIYGLNFLILQTELPVEPQFAGTTLTVPRGGTGATSFATGQCLVGAGTGAVTTGACGTGGSIDQLGQIGDVSTTTLAYGSVIRYNTANSKWESVATSTLGISGSGTVTSVAATVPIGMRLTGSPITTSGTLAFNYDILTGYIPFGGTSNVMATSSNLFWDNTNLRLGIGTTTPNEKLSFGYNDKIQMTSSQANENGELIRLRFASTTEPTAKAIIAFQNEQSQSKVWLVAHDYLSYPTDRHQHFSIEAADTSGQLQSRFIVPYDCDYNCDLKINQGNLVIQRNSGQTNGNLSVGGAWNDDNQFDFYPNYASNGSIAFRVATSTNNNIYLSMIGGSQIDIDDNINITGSGYFSGSLGIGTTSPANQLSIEKSGSSGTVLGATLELRQNQTSINATANSNLGEILFSGADILAGETGVGAKIRAQASSFWNATTNDYPTDLLFFTMPDTGAGEGGGLAERLRITRIGNVGIGTTTPLAKLNVYGGNVAFQTTVNSATAFQILNAATSSVFTVDTITGNIGIGTTTPAMKFSVQGDALADSWNVYSDIYTGDALTELAKIKTEVGQIGNWQEVDHKTLPEGILKVVRVNQEEALWQEITKEIIDEEGNSQKIIESWEQKETKQKITPEEFDALPEEQKFKDTSYDLDTLCVSCLTEMNTKAILQLKDELGLLKGFGGIDANGAVEFKQELKEEIKAELKTELSQYIDQKIEEKLNSLGFWEKIKLLFK